MSALPQHLDLHLIRILYLLLVEKNVSRIALKLNQPQPSISASLRKLRELTGGPLLVRGARGMVPTQSRTRSSARCVPTAPTPGARRPTR
jgi:DNA-binding transcriptional LysR family regulator